MTSEELVELLYKEFYVKTFNSIRVPHLDFTKYNCNVDFQGMHTAKDLVLGGNEAGGNLVQSYNTARHYIYQTDNEAGIDLHQENNTAGQRIYQHNNTFGTMLYQTDPIYYQQRKKLELYEDDSVICYKEKNKCSLKQAIKKIGKRKIQEMLDEIDGEHVLDIL